MSLNRADDITKILQSGTLSEALSRLAARDDAFIRAMSKPGVIQSVDIEAPLKYKEVPSVDKDPIENYRHKRYILTGDVLNAIRALVNSKVHLTPQSRLTEITLRMRLPPNGLPCEQFLEDMFSILNERFPESETCLEAMEYSDTP